MQRYASMCKYILYTISRYNDANNIFYKDEFGGKTQYTSNKTGQKQNTEEYT